MSPFNLKELTGKVKDLYSEDQKRYLKGLGKCPRCETRGTVSLVDNAGNVLQRKLDLRLSVKPGSPVFARCKHCEASWPIWADQKQALPATQQDPTIEIVETERTVEKTRVESMCLDNRSGTSPLRRTVTKSEEWSRSYELTGEATDSSSRDAKLNLTGANFGRKAERALKSGYGLTEEKRAVLTDSFDFEVPPNTLREVQFIYKCVWQHGFVRVEENGEIHEAPFRVAVDLKVDLAQKDTAA
jgi:hypothetical protein